jgi:alkylated DNA repair protein (DNA oxidative demethylase)
MSKRGLLYIPKFIKPAEKETLLTYLRTLHPIWEMRFSKNNPAPNGSPNRQLLRPVYWLGNWQFACLDYYHPPKGIYNRCVEAESFPPIMAEIVAGIEGMVHSEFLERDIPKGWHLNTCLINYYGSKIEDGKKNDVARVGEHRDFEPGPVASVSLGERALFQFVSSRGKQSQSYVVLQQWLEDCSLQIFGSDRFKKQLFHRIQRVEKKLSPIEGLNTTNFETRRINFTFRYVPDEHILRFSKLPLPQKEDVRPYLQELARYSAHFTQALEQD